MIFLFVQMEKLFFLFFTLSRWQTTVSPFDRAHSIWISKRSFFIYSISVAALDRATQGSSLMSVWSTSTGRNSVFGTAESGGAALATSHLPLHVHVAHTHLRNADGHCFHKPYHEHCQVGRFSPVDPTRQQVVLLFHSVS